MKLTPVGPAILAIGDPTQALGAGMKVFKRTQTTGINTGIRKAYVSDAVANGVPRSGQGYQMVSQPEVQAALVELKEFKTLVPGATVTAAGSNASTETVETVGLPDRFTAIDAADEAVLCVIPAAEASLGTSAPNALWLFVSGAESVDGIQFGEVSPGRIQQPYNTRFMGALRETDHADDPIPVGAQMGFFGPPANLGLTWSLPSLA